MATPSRRALIVGGAGVLAVGTGVVAVSRNYPRISTIAVASYSFEDSNLCLLTAAVEEGPCYVDAALIRSDVREDRGGLATSLKLKIVDANGCAPLPGAAVDVWHCDAAGDYSAAGARFLRGRQIADGSGFVSFTTIYPGWYPGRTPHIHLKVLTNAREAATTQLFFPEKLSNEIYATEPYAARGLPQTTNANDGVLRAGGGAQGTWPKITRTSAGLSATLTIGVQRPV